LRVSEAGANQLINQRLGEQLDFRAVAALVSRPQQAERIFVVGAGRTSLALKAAAMRLIHLFMNVLLVNKTSRPAIQANNLLLAGSGPGTTSTIVKAAEKAAAAGTMGAISTAADSPLGP